MGQLLPCPPLLPPGSTSIDVLWFLETIRRVVGCCCPESSPNQDAVTVKTFKCFVSQGIPAPGSEQDPSPRAPTLRALQAKLQLIHSTGAMSRSLKWEKEQTLGLVLWKSLE